MFKIIPVENKKQLKQFIQFQIDLYKDCPYFVPTLISDELRNLNPKTSPYMQNGEAEAQCFLCVDENDKIVGRVCGIISHIYNEKNKEKRVRISRFDTIDNIEVAKMLLESVENWGRERGMEVIHGPLGFNDMEREGLLIEGFDLISTYNTQYYYPYYQKLVESLGYEKEVDWIEHRFKQNDTSDERMKRVGAAVAKRLRIHELEIKSINWLVKNYYNEIFDVLDEAYGTLYGTVPITQQVRDSLVGQFKLILNKDLISILVDDVTGKIVAVGIMFPCISKSVQKAKGKLFPFGWMGVLKEIKHFDVIEMGLIGVRREYQNKGVTAIIFHKCIDRLRAKYDFKYCETNLELEDNYKIQKLFEKDFDIKQVRRRRCYYKSLNGQKVTLHKAITMDAEIPEKLANEQKTTKKKKSYKKDKKIF